MGMDYILFFFTKLSISKNFSFIKLNPKAPADAAKTEASSGAFIPTENVIAKAKISKSHPLSFAENEVLNPIIKQNPNKISNRVEAHPINGINDGGIIGFSVRVYFKKLSQLPHAETSLLHKPKRSATAERKPTPMDIRKKSLTTFTFIVSFLGTPKVHLMKMKLFWILIFRLQNNPVWVLFALSICKSQTISPIQKR